MASGLETEARSGRALTSICKNAYGRAAPYNTDLWIAFCQRLTAGSREQAQLYVRLDGSGLQFLASANRPHGTRRSRLFPAITYCTSRLCGSWRTAVPSPNVSLARPSLPQTLHPGHSIRFPDWSQGRSFDVAAACRRLILC